MVNQIFCRNIRKRIHRIKDIIYMFNDKLLNKPHEIKIELTYKCNKDCYFCFNKNSKSSKKELDTITILYLLDKIKKEGVKRIRFTGGEPLLKNDILKILKYAKGKGLIVKLNTNGYLINSGNISIIKNNCDEILFSIHDLKDNNINRLVKKIKNIRKSGCIIKISTIATKDNIKKYKKILDIINKINPDCWYWNYPIPTTKELIDWNDILKLVNKIKMSKLKFNCKAIRFPLCNIDKKMERYIEGCRNCGPYDHLVIAPDGEIHLCNSFSFKLGDINDSIIGIWRNHELVKKFKTHEILPNECKKCTKMIKCFGGCRYSAYLNKGNLDSKHPLCIEAL